MSAQKRAATNIPKVSTKGTRPTARHVAPSQMIPVLAYHRPYAGIGVPGFGVTDEAHGP